jgi:hypothetical protein
MNGNGTRVVAAHGASVPVRLGAPLRNPAFLLVALVWATVLACLPIAGLEVQGFIGGALLGTVGLGTLSLFYTYLRPDERIAEASGYTALWLLFSLGGCLLTYLAAVGGRPLQDAAFQATDAALGFDWGQWTAWIRERGWLRLALRLAYASLPLQIVVTVLVLAFTRTHRRNRELMLAATFAVLVTSVGYAWLPAMGPFATVPLPGTLPSDTVYIPHVEALRGPGPYRVDVVELQGIIVLPSYHTVLGVLFVWAHRGLPWSFPVFLVLNVLMLASVPSEGGHYLVDLLAGLVVALIAVVAARRLT